MFQWSDESIAWYKRAAENTGFFQELSDTVKPYIKSSETLCEIGCGHGYLSLGLSACVRKVTAVDIEKRVLNVMENEMALNNRNNIDILNADWKVLSGRFWDTVLACNFGHLPQDIPDFLGMCARQLILVHRVQDDTRKISSVLIQEYLQNNGYGFAFLQRKADFGQLFISKEEAFRFFLHYGWIKENGQEDFLAKNLQTTGIAKYPFYFPSRSTVSIFVIRKQQVEILK